MHSSAVGHHDIRLILQILPHGDMTADISKATS
jgi:hypothetical protein